MTWDEALCRRAWAADHPEVSPVVIGGRVHAAYAVVTPDWFADEGTPEANAAVAICRHCPVAAACLATALKGEQTEQDRVGIFGGMTADDRRAAWGKLRPDRTTWGHTAESGRDERWLSLVEDDGRLVSDIAREERIDKSAIYKAIKRLRLARAEGSLEHRRDLAWGKVQQRERAMNWLAAYEAGTSMTILASRDNIHPKVVHNAVARARLVRDVA